MSSQPKRRPQKRKVNKRYRNYPVWIDGHIEWLTEAEHRAHHARHSPGKVEAAQPQHPEQHHEQ